MNSNTNYQSALGILRGALAGLKPGTPVFGEIVTQRDQVIARYRPSFQNPDTLSTDEFNSFLYIENNHHWSGLYRKGLRKPDEMPRLCEALRLFLDETRPIDQRFQDGIGMIPGMGKALASAILLIMFPDKCGVWNNTSESGLKAVNLWPQLGAGASLGQKYRKVNQILLDLSRDLGADLWTLDAIWWALLPGSELPKGMSGASATVSVSTSPLQVDSIERQEPEFQANQRFGLERHLQNFLLDNWDRTELGKDWSIYSEDGEEEAGYEYSTPVGRIDLLAKHRREPRWLVVELKRDQTGDQTIGQVLRYMGWVKQHLAKTSEAVEGLIVAHETDDATRYAVSAIPGVRLMLYRVQFTLAYAPAIESK